MPLDRAPGVRLVCFGHVGAVRLLSPPPLLPLPGREPVRAWQRAAGRGSPPPGRTSVTHLPQFPPCYSPSAGPAASAWRRAALTKLLQGRLVQPPPSPRERGHRAPLGRRDRRRRSRLTAVGALAPAAGSVPTSRVLPHVCECAGVCVCTHTRMCAIARERTACERLQARTHARG